jgi:hypothetical protein
MPNATSNVDTQAMRRRLQLSRREFFEQQFMFAMELRRRRTMRSIARDIPARRCPRDDSCNGHVTGS